jgi:hypothetical protein
MKATAILRDFSDVFYNGGHGIPSFLALSPMERFEKLVSMGNEQVPVRCGNGSFRDRVEFNQLRRGPCSVTCKIEPRRGYKLATFEFSKP